MRGQKAVAGRRRRRQQRLERAAESHSRRPRCPIYGKARFFSESEADVAIRRIAEEPARDGDRPTRAYWCESCGDWHLTKMPKAQP